MTVAMLSWGSHNTLIQTLESYKKFGLNNLDEDRIIFFQQFSDEDFHIATTYGWMPFGSDTNVGIAEGYKALVDAAEGENFLFLENDWELIRDPNVRFMEAEWFLESGYADVIKLRDRRQPGNPLWSRQFAGNEVLAPQYLLDSVHWDEYPERFDNISKVQYITVDPWWSTTSRYANWSNNPHMAKTQFLKDNLLPRIGGDIEQQLQPWWQEQDFVVVQGEGLFTHNRID